jgi:hypothetical protein
MAFQCQWRGRYFSLSFEGIRALIRCFGRFLLQILFCSVDFLSSLFSVWVQGYVALLVYI